LSQASADAVAVAVELAGVGDERAVVAGVADAVAVAVLLVGVRHVLAVVAGVALAVAVGVELVAVGVDGQLSQTSPTPSMSPSAWLALMIDGSCRTVADAVAVAVGLTRVGAARAAVAGVAHPVAVGVELGRVDRVRAVVAGVSLAVAVAVDLGRVGRERAVVAGVPPPVAVESCCVGLGLAMQLSQRSPTRRRRCRAG